MKKGETSMNTSCLPGIHGLERESDSTIDHQVVLQEVTELSNVYHFSNNEQDQFHKRHHLLSLFK